MGTHLRFAIVLVTVIGIAGASLLSPAPQIAQSAASAPSNPLYLPFLQSNNSAWPLTTDSFIGADSQPHVSPDGKSVVFLRTLPNGQTDIYRVPFNQGMPVNITQSPDVAEDTPRFMPGGNEIIFARRAPGETWDIYTISITGTRLTKVVSDSTSNQYNEVHPFVSNRLFWGALDSRLLYSSDATGNWEIYEQGGNPSPGVTANSTAANRFPSLSPDGLTVLFRSERNGNSDIATSDFYFSPTLKPLVSSPAFDGYPSFIPDQSGVVFDSDRTNPRHSFVVNPIGNNLHDLAASETQLMRDSAISPDSRWQIYASGPSMDNTRLYVRAFESPLYQIGARGRALLPAGKCDWEAQSLAMAWAMTYAMTHDSRYIDWAREFVDACAPARTQFEINDGLIGYAALMVYEHTQQASYLTYARSIADWMLGDARRTADGTFTHEQFNDLVWADTLLGITPLLTELSRITHDQRYVVEAAQQVILHAKHLQDPDTFLYHHAWQESTNSYFGPVYWARGNGWAMFGNTLVANAIRGRIPEGVTRDIDDIIRSHLVGLSPAIDGSGRWHTVINQPNTYLETSGSGLISFALGTLWQCGLNNLSLHELSLTNSAIWQQVAPDGTVQDVQGPTGPLNTADAYNALPHNAPQLYGQAIGMLNSLRTNTQLCSWASPTHR